MKVRVEYGRKYTQNLNGDFDTANIGAAVEIDVPEEADWQSYYDRLYAQVSKHVDRLMDVGQDAPAPAPQAQVEKEVVFAPMPGEKISPQKIAETTGGTVMASSEFTTPTTLSQIVPNDPVIYTRCKVWRVGERTTPWGAKEAEVRIGNKDQIPDGFVTAKSSEPHIMSTMLALKEGDYIDVKGYYRPWKGNDTRDEPKYDLIAQEIVKSKAKVAAAI